MFKLILSTLMRKVRIAMKISGIVHMLMNILWFLLEKLMILFIKLYHIVLDYFDMKFCLQVSLCFKNRLIKLVVKFQMCYKYLYIINIRF